MVEYNLYLSSVTKYTPVQWFGIAVVIALVLGGLAYVIAPGLPMVTLMLPLLIIIAFIGYPIIMKQRRDGEIEGAIPDVLEELATSLRAGATIEQALVDLTKIQRGPLTEELKVTLKDMDAGISFEDSLQNMINRLEIPLLKQILTIVIDGRKSGAELASILDAVGDDARKLSRIRRERVSKTMMQVIFLFGAAAGIAPLIFAFVSEMISLVKLLGASKSVDLIPMILQGYLIISTIMTGVMIAIIRGEKMWRGIVIYGATMAVIAMIIFTGARVFAAAMFAV